MGGAVAPLLDPVLEPVPLLPLIRPASGLPARSEKPDEGDVPHATKRAALTAPAMLVYPEESVRPFHRFWPMRWPESRELITETDGRSPQPLQSTEHPTQSIAEMAHPLRSMQHPTQSMDFDPSLLLTLPDLLIFLFQLSISQARGVDQKDQEVQEGDEELWDRRLA